MRALTELSKIERGHAQDVQQMLTTGLVVPVRLLELFEAINSELYRYPAIDPPSFRRALDRALAE